jgi:hypothetical protein
VDAKTIAMVRRSGRSWWVARYRDGREIAEWYTGSKLAAALGSPLVVKPNTSRWEEVPKDGLIGLAMVCPNGQVCVLEAQRDRALFQLKAGRMTVTGPDRGHYTDAHVIGSIGPNGSADCWAFEYMPHTYVARIAGTPGDRCVTCGLGPEICTGRDPRNVVRFRDDPLNMAYRNIGPLHLDVLGVVV